MKKLNLKLDNIKEMLTKEQMKKIVGGYGDNGGCPSGQVPCNCSSDKGSFSGCVSSIEDCWTKC